MPDSTLKITLTSNVSFDMILVQGGSFLMGNEAYSSEQPIHTVKVPDFFIGKFPVTQALWKAVMDGDTPAFFKGENRPVEQVSWLQAQDFIEKLNALTQQPFRLPSEAEWEYAARGGQFSQGYYYSGSDKLKQVGWYDENSGRETHDVGLLLANELGIHDMSGNVWEWCADDWHADYNAAPDDGTAWVDNPNRGVNRVLRGGSYFYEALLCRPSSRFRNAPVNRSSNIGFRLACPLQSVG